MSFWGRFHRGPGSRRVKACCEKGFRREAYTTASCVSLQRPQETGAWSLWRNHAHSRGWPRRGLLSVLNQSHSSDNLVLLISGHSGILSLGGFLVASRLRRIRQPCQLRLQFPAQPGLLALPQMGAEGE